MANVEVYSRWFNNCLLIPNKLLQRNMEDLRNEQRSS